MSFATSTCGSDSSGEKSFHNAMSSLRESAEAIAKKVIERSTILDPKAEEAIPRFSSEGAFAWDLGIGLCLPCVNSFYSLYFFVIYR